MLCLVAYPGLTATEIQSITGMNQPQVARSIRDMVLKDMIIIKTGKRISYGRPYNFYEAAPEMWDIIFKLEETFREFA